MFVILREHMLVCNFHSSFFPCFSISVTGITQHVRVEADYGRYDGGRGDIIAPERQDKVYGSNLKRDEEAFEQEEVPAKHETPSPVNPFAGVLDECGAHRHEDGHLGE